MRPSHSNLFPFLQQMQYSQSHRLARLRNSQCRPRRPNQIYVRINEQLEAMWEEFEVRMM